LVKMFGGGGGIGLSTMIGKKCIIRTYSAGCWFGEIAEKSGTEVIVKNARRMWRWQAAKGISLSAVALYGLDYDGCKIVEAVESVWLDAIEIIPCTDVAIAFLEGAPDVKAE
jgi:hypothetical protein